MSIYEDGDIALISGDDIGVMHWVRVDGLWYYKPDFDLVGADQLAGSEITDEHVSLAFEYAKTYTLYSWGHGLGVLRGEVWIPEPEFDTAQQE